MYDSVTPRNILNHTTTPQMVAGYANGRYAWTQEEWDLFPNAVKVRIAVRSNFYDAHVLDCEEGDATPAQCPAWARQRRLMGGVPIIYCNRSTLPLVRQAFQNQDTEQPLFWIATASGRAEYPPDSIGAQYLLDWQGVDVSVMGRPRRTPPRRTARPRPAGPTRATTRPRPPTGRRPGAPNGRAPDR